MFNLPSTHFSMVLDVSETRVSGTRTRSGTKYYFYYYFDDSNNLTGQACRYYWLIGLVLVILELGTCSIKNDRLSSRIVMDCEVVNHNRSISYISKVVGTAISPPYICGGFKILQLICICKIFFLFVAK